MPIIYERPIEVYSITPQVAFYSPVTTLFTFQGRNLMDLTKYKVSCVLSNKPELRYPARVIDQSRIECHVEGPRQLTAASLDHEYNLKIGLRVEKQDADTVGRYETILPGDETHFSVLFKTGTTGSNSQRETP